MLEFGLVAVSGALFFLTACVLGANNVALAWGPAIGAKVIRYELAAPIAAFCAALGAVLFGTRSVPIYSGYLKDWQELKDFPEMSQEALFWPPVAIIGWQLLSLYYQVPAVHHLGFAAAIAGAATIYPGWDHIDWGTHSHIQPYLSGLGLVYLSWLVVPLLALVFVASIFLPMRSKLFRAEDPFYTVLWTVSIVGGVTAIINTTYILYTLSSVSGWHLNHLPAQGIVIVLCAVAMFGCLVTWVSIPTIIKNAQKTARRADPVTRANLLGLDDDVVYSLSRRPPATGLKAQLLYWYRQLVDRDIVAVIRQDPALLQIHNRGEEFDRPAEDCFAQMQTWTCALLSMGHGAATFNYSVNCFASILHFSKTYSVTANAPVPLHLRFTGAAGIMLGILFAGWRLVPAAGVQIAKMSPFRSYVVTTASALTASVVFNLGLGGGATTYINITAVVAVGLVEGTTHVNWPKVGQILKWWVLTIIPIFLATAILFGQGSAPPSVNNIMELELANMTILANIRELSVMGVDSLTLQDTQVNVHQVAVLVEEVAKELQKAVQQAVTALEAVQATCHNVTASS